MRLWVGTVASEWLDYNGHMTEHRYLQVFGESSDALYKRIGVKFEQASAGAYYTLESHIRHLHEAHSGAHLWTETTILGYDAKRLHLLHVLRDDRGRDLATGEHLAIHVADGASCDAPAAMLQKIAGLFVPGDAGRLPARLGSVLNRRLDHSRLAGLTGGTPPPGPDPACG